MTCNLFSNFLPGFLPSLLPSFLSSFLPFFLPSLLPSFLSFFLPSYLSNFAWVEITHHCRTSLFRLLRMVVTNIEVTTWYYNKVERKKAIDSGNDPLDGRRRENQTKRIKEEIARFSNELEEEASAVFASKYPQTNETVQGKEVRAMQSSLSSSISSSSSSSSPSPSSSSSSSSSFSPSSLSSSCLSSSSSYISSPVDETAKEGVSDGSSSLLPSASVGWELD